MTTGHQTIGKLNYTYTNSASPLNLLAAVLANPDRMLDDCAIDDGDLPTRYPTADLLTFATSANRVRGNVHIFSLGSLQKSRIEHVFHYILHVMNRIWLSHPQANVGWF